MALATCAVARALVQQRFQRGAFELQVARASSV
jgi:hypothetical protein